MSEVRVTGRAFVSEPPTVRGLVTIGAETRPLDDASDCHSWFRTSGSDDGDATTEQKPVGVGQTYVPGPDDVGGRLRVQIVANAGHDSCGDATALSPLVDVSVEHRARIHGLVHSRHDEGFAVQLLPEPPADADPDDRLAAVPGCEVTVSRYRSSSATPAGGACTRRSTSATATRSPTG